MKRYRLIQEQGIVSLVTVVIASILFSVIVVSMVSVVASEERQASEADLSNRAYFAAESGVENGLLLIKQSLTNGTPLQENSCIAGPGTTSGATYTCLYMSSASQQLNNSLTADGNAYQIDLSAIPNIKRIVISWHEPSVSGDGAVYNLISPSTDINHLFSAASAWSYPAVVDVQSILFHATNNPTTTGAGADIKIIEYALAPTQGGLGGVLENDSSFDTTSGSIGTNPDLQPVRGDCIPEASVRSGVAGSYPYACTATITVSDPIVFKRIFRLRARYANTHFGIQVYDSSGTLITVPDSYESISVTAKAGDTSRKVLAKVALKQSTVALDYALYSDTDICHDFELRDAYSGSHGHGSGGVDNYGSCPF